MQKARDLARYLEDSPKLAEIYQECRATTCISFNLPPRDATAGKALKHAICEVQKLFSKHEPLIFKFGFTQPGFSVEQPNLRIQERPRQMVEYGNLVPVHRTMWTCYDGSIPHRQVLQSLGNIYIGNTTLYERITSFIFCPYTNQNYIYT